jgi:hypothetical protein
MRSPTHGQSKSAARRTTCFKFLLDTTPVRKDLLSLALVLLSVPAIAAPAHRKSTGTKFYGELEPRLYTSPDLMSNAVFSPISIDDAKRLGVIAEPADKTYSGEFSLPDGGNVRNIYKAVIVRASGGKDIMYVDANRNGRFDAGERILFLPVTDPSFSRLQKIAAFNVALPAGGAFRTCPMLAALARGQAKSPATSLQLEVEYTSAPYVRGFAVLPGRSLPVRFQYDFEIGGISLTYGYEWLDLNNDGKFDMKPGSPEFLHGNGANPIFHVGNLALQVESVDLKRDQFILRTVDASAPKPVRRLSLPFTHRSR